jgi:hypothetical protein
VDGDCCRIYYWVVGQGVVQPTNIRGCRIEIPLLNAIYPRLLENDKQLIGVNQSESQETIDKFRENTSIAFPVYRDNGELSRKLNIQIIPAIAVIGKNGKVQSITYGFRPWIQAYLLWWV